MDWLLHNPVADMYGPTFLVFYAVTIVLTLTTCLLVLRASDWTARLSPPVIPQNPDPYEIAYLRGGENEVARSVIFALVQRGFLRLASRGGPAVEQAEKPKEEERRSMSSMERRVFDWFSKPHTVNGLFDEEALPRHLKPFCAAYEQKLQSEKLLTPTDLHGRTRQVMLAGAAIILGLGGYKLLVALSRGRFNVVFLILLAAAGTFVLSRLCRTGRLSRRGRVYLAKLQLAFERLRLRPLPQTAPVGGGGDGAALAAFDPALLLLVGVYGVSALAGTPFDSYRQTFAQSAASQGAGGSWGGTSTTSCGSTSGGSSSSDSGSSCSSGSSGSSCGSSCGGGGCGGCGS